MASKATPNRVPMIINNKIETKEKNVVPYYKTM